VWAPRACVDILEKKKKNVCTNVDSNPGFSRPLPIRGGSGSISNGSSSSSSSYQCVCEPFINYLH
jgi:hypothetical protein